jgi:hypothetical protein
MKLILLGIIMTLCKSAYSQTVLDSLNDTSSIDSSLMIRFGGTHLYGGSILYSQPKQDTLTVTLLCSRKRGITFAMPGKLIRGKWGSQKLLFSNWRPVEDDPNIIVWDYRVSTYIK